MTVGSRQSAVGSQIAGRAIPLRGDDIDTDRIMPARFLKAVSFEGLERHVFEDDRAADPAHPFNDARYAGAAILVVNKNFGCGSSREHAPQALLRWGIKALVGESFADIFFGNCVALGMPCVTARAADVAALLAAVEEDPAHDLVVDVQEQTASYRGRVYAVALPASARSQLLDGSWDATATLLQAQEQVRQTAARLPYTTNFAR